MKLPQRPATQARPSAHTLSASQGSPSEASTRQRPSSQRAPRSHGARPAPQAREVFTSRGSAHRRSTHQRPAAQSGSATHSEPTSRRGQQTPSQRAPSPHIAPPGGATETHMLRRASRGREAQGSPGSGRGPSGGPRRRRAGRRGRWRRSPRGSRRPRRCPRHTPRVRTHALGADSQSSSTRTTRPRAPGSTKNTAPSRGGTHRSSAGECSASGHEGVGARLSRVSRVRGRRNASVPGESSSPAREGNAAGTPLQSPASAASRSPPDTVCAHPRRIIARGARRRMARRIQQSAGLPWIGRQRPEQRARRVDARAVLSSTPRRRRIDP